jgi:hypothetical protein
LERTVAVPKGSARFAQNGVRLIPVKRRQDKVGYGEGIDALDERGAECQQRESCRLKPKAFRDQRRYGIFGAAQA